MRVPEAFKQQLADLVGERITGLLRTELAEIEALLQEADREAEALLTEADLGGIMAHVRHLPMNVTEIEQRLERRIQLERAYEGRQARRGVRGVVNTIRPFAYFNPMNPVAYLTVIGQVTGALTDRQAQAEAETETLTKVRDSLRTELNRILARVQREWLGFLRDMLRDQLDQILPQIEAAIESQQARKSADLGTTRQRLQHQLQGLDTTARDLDDAKRGLGTFERDVTTLLSELRKAFGTMITSSSSRPSAVSGAPRTSSPPSAPPASRPQRQEMPAPSAPPLANAPTAAETAAVSDHPGSPDASPAPTPPPHRSAAPPPPAADAAPLLSIGTGFLQDLQNRQLSEAFRAALAKAHIALSDKVAIINPGNGPKCRVSAFEK